MTSELRRTSRLLALAASLALAPSALGCALSSDSDGATGSEDAITDVNHTKVKRQSIGNCWVYATASWLESMNLSATGRELNASESYISFWHWFEQIVGNDLDEKGEVPTGGSWSEAGSLLSKYGVVTEAAFIASEATKEMSARQDSALDTINTSLKSGALSTATARKDRALVRRELGKAWGLTTGVSATLDKVFGANVSRNLLSSSTQTAGTFVKRTSEIPAAYTRGPGKPMVTTTLAAAISEWTLVSYRTTRSGTSQRAFQKRFQRALHDNQPVIVSWFVDFNALDSQGRFYAPPAKPGHQGGHMTVMEDYEVENVPGFGTLKAGVLETRPEAKNAALSDAATIKFIRIKNSWGSARADRQFAVPGYHDLYMKYLNGPVKQCDEKADGSPNTSSCWDTVPLRDVVLPPGY